jgi:hypothetical protein
MAHFAELDENNIVLGIISIHNNELLVDGVESEEKGIIFCNTIKPSKWVQTSLNNNMRKQYAQVGGKYDEEKNIFINAKPSASWILDENDNWQPPVPKPEGYFYWNEESLSWLPIPDAG